MARFLFFLACSTTVVGIALSFGVSKSYLWVATVSSWIASFLASFSIGLYLLVVTFVLLTLATGYSARWIRHGKHLWLAVGAGVGLWLIAVSTVDDYWLFLPLSFLLQSLIP